jgi:hypothetical protein
MGRECERYGGSALPDGIFVRVPSGNRLFLVRREGSAGMARRRCGRSGRIPRSENCPVRLEPGGGEIPPIAKGFAEGSRSQGALAEDRERIAIYKRIEKDLSQEPNPLWNLIDQIDLTFTKSVNMRLAHPPVLVHIGSTDFRKRFERALQVLQAVRQRDSESLSRFRVQDIDRLIQNADNISFIDAASGDRIVVNIATPAQRLFGRKYRTSPRKK